MLILCSKDPENLTEIGMNVFPEITLKPYCATAVFGILGKSDIRIQSQNMTMTEY